MPRVLELLAAEAANSLLGRAPARIASDRPLGGIAAQLRQRLYVPRYTCAPLAWRSSGCANTFEHARNTTHHRAERLCPTLRSLRKLLRESWQKAAVSRASKKSARRKVFSLSKSNT